MNIEESRLSLVDLLNFQMSALVSKKWRRFQQFFKMKLTTGATLSAAFQSWTPFRDVSIDWNDASAAANRHRDAGGAVFIWPPAERSSFRLSRWPTSNFWASTATTTEFSLHFFFLNILLQFHLFPGSRNTRMIAAGVAVYCQSGAQPSINLIQISWI
jgi:hypothetical protein